MEQVNCAIIGSGNIGTDLMMKIDKHPRLQLAMLIGIDPDSEGLALARQMGYETTRCRTYLWTWKNRIIRRINWRNSNFSNCLLFHL